MKGSTAIAALGVVAAVGVFYACSTSEYEGGVSSGVVNVDTGDGNCSTGVLTDKIVFTVRGQQSKSRLDIKIYHPYRDEKGSKVIWNSFAYAKEDGTVKSEFPCSGRPPGRYEAVFSSKKTGEEGSGTFDVLKASD